MVTVLVAHERRLVRQALAKILSLQDEISVLGDAATGSDAADKAAKLKPDVIIVDSVMPGLDSLPSSANNGGSHCPEMVIYPRQKHGENGDGVSHLTYDDDIGELIDAVFNAVGASSVSGTHKVHQVSIEGLTKREEEVLPLLGDGLSNKQIAHRLGITERTVKYHISNILRKLDLFSRTEAAIAFLKGSLANS